MEMAGALREPHVAHIQYHLVALEGTVSRAMRSTPPPPAQALLPESLSDVPCLDHHSVPESPEKAAVGYAAAGLYFVLEDILEHCLERPISFDAVLRKFQIDLEGPEGSSLPGLRDVFAMGLVKVVGKLMAREFSSTKAATLSLEEQNASLRHEIRACIKRLSETQVEAEGLKNKAREKEREMELLQESLVCAVCLEQFVGRDPVAFECGHIFCSECSAQVMRSDACPTCRAPIGVPRVLRGLG